MADQSAIFLESRIIIELLSSFNKFIVYKFISISIF